MSYQTLSWGKRPFRAFLNAFDQHLKGSSSVDGVERVIERLKPTKAPHDQVVPIALGRWLPKLLPPH